jgi:hypothetical protein
MHGCTAQAAVWIVEYGMSSKRSPAGLEATREPLLLGREEWGCNEWKTLGSTHRPGARRAGCAWAPASSLARADGPRSATFSGRGGAHCDFPDKSAMFGCGSASTAAPRGVGDGTKCRDAPTMEFDRRTCLFRRPLWLKLPGASWEQTGCQLTVTAGSSFSREVFMHARHASVNITQAIASTLLLGVSSQGLGQGQAQAQTFLVHGTPRTCSAITQLDSALSMDFQQFFAGWTEQDYLDAVAWSQACAEYGWHIAGRPRISLLQAQHDRALASAQAETGAAAGSPSPSAPAEAVVPAQAKATPTTPASSTAPPNTPSSAVPPSTPPPDTVVVSTAPASTPPPSTVVASTPPPSTMAASTAPASASAPDIVPPANSAAPAGAPAAATGDVPAGPPHVLSTATPGIPYPTVPVRADSGSPTGPIWT